MSNKQYKAYLRVRRLDTRECVHSVGLFRLDDRYVERVMAGMLINMNMDDYFIDDSEVDEARAKNILSGNTSTKTGRLIP